MLLENLSIHGRQMTLTEAIKNYAEEKVSKVGKFNDGIKKVDVTLSATKLKSGNVHIAEILVYLSGKTIKATAKEEDLYYAIDKATDAIEVQVKKYKEKYMKSHNQEKVQFVMAEGGADPDTKQLVRVFLPKKPMEPSEAILQLETLNKVFFPFINEKTGKMEIVYKRKDGDYGYIKE